MINYVSAIQSISIKKKNQQVFVSFLDSLWPRSSANSHEVQARPLN